MHSLLSLARKSRKKQTDAETILWVHIRKKQINGVKFKRQIPIGKYIVDRKKIVISMFQRICAWFRLLFASSDRESVTL